MDTIMNLRRYVEAGETEHVKIYKKDAANDIFIFKEIPPKLTIGTFSLFIKLLEDLGGKHCIMVYKTDITPHVKTILETTNIDPVIEVFSENELIFDITRHVLQPNFEVETNTAMIAKKYGFANLPKFLPHDPIVKRFGWRKHTIVKILPKNGLNPSWRIVA